MSTTSIKTATQAAIRAVGGVDAAASFARVGRSQLSDYQNRHSPSIVPVDVAVELDKCAQEPIILSAMALAEGHSLVALHFGEGDVAASVADIAETSGETLREAVLVLADGVVTQEEAVALEQRLHDLQRAVSHSLNVVRGIAHPEAASASVRRVS